MLRVLLITKSKPLIEFCRKNTPGTFDFKAATKLNLRTEYSPGILIFDSAYLVQHTDAQIVAAAEKFGADEGGVSINILMGKENRNQAFSLFPDNLRHVNSILSYNIADSQVNDISGAEWRWFLETSRRRLKLSGQIALMMGENRLLAERLAQIKPQLRTNAQFPPFMHGKSNSIVRFREQVLSAATAGSYLFVKTKDEIPVEPFLEYYTALLRPENAPTFRVVDLAKVPKHLHAAALFAPRPARRAPRTRAGKSEPAVICLLNLDNLGAQNQVQLLAELNRQRDAVDAADSANRLVIFASDKLSRSVKRGTFRQELYSMLKRRIAEVPPLHERAEDITQIAGEYIARSEFNALRSEVVQIAAKILSRFDLSSGYKGLFLTLELMNDLEKSKGLPVFELMEKSGNSEAFAAAQSFLREQAEPNPATLFLGLAGGEKDALSLEDVERNYISAVCERYGWQVTDAARHLKISRKTLYDKMRRYRLTRPEKSPDTNKQKVS